MSNGDEEDGPVEPIFVHERVFVGADTRERLERLVECPVEGAISFSRCERCPHFFESGHDERYGGEVVDCARAPLGQASAIPRHVERGGAPSAPVATVGDLMSRAYVALDPGVSIEVARRYLVDEQIGCLLVVDANRYPIGIVTLRDFVEKRELVESAAPGLTIADIATSPVTTVPAALPVARASAIMSFEGIHHLVVVDREGAASGVLSSLDVLRWLGQRAGMLVPRTTARQRASSFATGGRSKP